MARAVPNLLRAGWPSTLLTDPRVEHYWDEKVLGTWYGENVTAKTEGHVEWDAYFLYPGRSAWGETGLSGLVSWGWTIVKTREQLKKDLPDLPTGD